MRIWVLFLAVVLSSAFVSTASSATIDSVYADSVFFGPLGVTSPEQALKKPDQVYAHLAGAVDFSMGFKRYEGSVATGMLIPIKVGATIVVSGKPDPSVSRSALGIILVKLAFDESILYQSDPFVMDGTEKTISVTDRPYDYVLFTMADSSTSFDLDAVLLMEDTSQETGAVRAEGYRPTMGLIANYPNPFMNSTNVSFATPSGGQVSLVAVDMQGTEYARTDLGMLAAGEHQASFDLRDHGMYFLRLFIDGRPVGNPIKIISQ